MPKPIILANKLYVPQSLVERSDLERWSYDWVETIYEDRLDDVGMVILKNNGEPEVVPVEYDRHLTTCHRVYTGFNDYYAFPRGNMAKLRPYLKSRDFFDLRAAPPLGFHIRIKAKTRRDERWKAQNRCIKKWIRKGYGLIQGTTGSGKTVIGVGGIARLGLKTLIISARKDAYKQWHKEFVKHSNLRRLEKEHDLQIVGEYKYTKKKMTTFPVTVATVQSFKNNSAGRARLRALQDEFGLVVLDEAHELCTEEYHQPIMLLNPLAFMSLSATPERTDRRHLLLYDMVGPIVAENMTEQMPPEVTFIETGEEAPAWLSQGRRNYSREYKWTMSLSHLAKSEARTEVILRWMIQDLQEERKFVAAYSERTMIIQKLRDRLRGEGFRVGYVDGSTKNRDKIYSDFRKRKIDVLCAGKVLNALVNIPEMNCLHVCTPVNKEANIIQIYGRARRIQEGKDMAEVRYYFDRGGQLYGAYKNNIKACKKFGWKIHEEDALIAAGMKKWARPSDR
jgi:superfamily II DNA or RNA helicase